MKTFLELELKTNYEKELVRMYGRKALQSKTLKSLATSWVAEMKLDHEGRLTRRFLSYNKDYSRANNAGTRGIYAEYILESGKIYEVKNFLTRYFCSVDYDGDIIKISETEAIEWLKAI